MPEDLNAEIAVGLTEGGAGVGEVGDRQLTSRRRDVIVEMLEALLLAVVAIATAWSGYQAARWDGRQAELYGEDAAIRIRADQLMTLGGQQRLLDVSTFNTWIEARTQGDTELAELYERRFSPEFKVAFDAWVALDPFSNPNAPPGPSFMPEYVNHEIERGLELNQEANRLFAEGTAAQRRAHEYIRTTVVLATVLFLLALSQRFTMSRVRIGVLVVAGGLLLFGVVSIVAFPRL